MIAKVYSSEGIVLAKRDYGEADRILVLFTKHFGKVSALAKGVKKLKSKKRGHLEIFSLIRFQAAKGKGLDIVTEAETIDNFGVIRKDLKKSSVAYFFCEVVGKLTKEEERNEELFEFLYGYLRRLKKTSSLKKFRNKFTKELLVLLGFWPRGKGLENPDMFLESVAERQFSSIRVGKKVLS